MRKGIQPILSLEGRESGLLPELETADPNLLSQGNQDEQSNPDRLRFFD